MSVEVLPTAAQLEKKEKKKKKKKKNLFAM